MLEFQNTPPKDPRGDSLPLIRCPANRGITGIILSDDLLGTETHYYHGRTLPCDRSNCPACSDGFPWRWHAYLSLYSSSTHRVYLLELTARAVEPLVQYRETYGTLRGCEIAAKRATTSPNSRVIITTRPAQLEGKKLPEAPNVLSALSILWNLPLSALQIQGTHRHAQDLSVADGTDKVLDPTVRYATARRNGKRTEPIPD